MVLSCRPWQMVCGSGVAVLQTMTDGMGNRCGCPADHDMVWAAGVAVLQTVTDGMGNRCGSPADHDRWHGEQVWLPCRPWQMAWGAGVAVLQTMTDGMGNRCGCPADHDRWRSCPAHQLNPAHTFRPTRSVSVSLKDLWFSPLDIV
jgi:hypothetical protein